MSRERVPPRSRHGSILPHPFAHPTCVPSRARTSGRTDPSATAEALPTWNRERIESSNRRSIALSGFHLASKRSCKQTARPTSATRFQRAYCRKRNDGSAMGRMLISDESTSLGTPGMQTRVYVLLSFNFLLYICVSQTRHSIFFREQENVYCCS